MDLEVVSSGPGEDNRGGGEERRACPGIQNLFCSRIHRSSLRRKQAHKEAKDCRCEDNESLEDEADYRSQLPSPPCPACDERRGRVQSSTIKTRQTLLWMPQGVGQRLPQDRTGQDSLLFSLHSSLRWESTPETIGSDKQLAPVTRADEKGSLLLL
jgi:hypothetical protein